ncbi:hypothetical protein AT15_07630 [Kosmotoga arenicorallina S304]|uniref:Thiamine biosynthesis protein ThiS n=1 Tax=Kosmotoga arenicorallina S304 TaxID=1453497 RepID=A0A176K2T9_9BACT|nr:MoaD/ThiS family protein [Kosmotoga arenicorallina]OAA31358.1 hypothetical protein AT15_07630 [Kosmotoga arenicorallina S304]
MKVFLDDKEFSFNKPISVKRLLESLNLNPESHIVLVNGAIKTPDSKISEDANVRIVRAVSGG